ncbi:MAG: alpha amylase C-terminal domain-containing protein [Peptococcaceae bacterium]|jgi:1,4-alpha-glucan branching enzyme|nr:alpha amylase C-terminal domain-containing protein [Peptococcaceae bacterium]
MNQNYKILELDPYLLPYREDIALRMRNYQTAQRRLLAGKKKLSSWANGHLYFGFQRTKDGWVYREWAPNAEQIHLIGEFNDWNRNSHPLTPIGDGIWEIVLPGADALAHASKVKIQIMAQGRVFDRIPAYCRRVIQDPQSKNFDGQIWQPEQKFPWSDQAFALRRDEPLLIYECHAGMSGEEAGVTSFRAFTEQVLPRVAKLGYTAIQLMAVMEHPYYGSFGYQVSNFFAVSSRFGTPEDLKDLINTAHERGIAVLLDLIHSHAAPNALEGLGQFDGTEYQFFHRGPRGDHPAWGTKLFHYAKPEVLHFLLSNIKFWLEEYHFDGFRFDGVTSMLYHNHGIGSAFTDYKMYFSQNTDTEAVTYLQLACELAKQVKPDCVLIAEDMSGMPGMAVPLADGGIGFDYRLGMGLPDYWIRILKERRDEQWNLGELWYELNRRRPGEPVIAYCESHDQALVGDQTLIFRLAGQEMYWHMRETDVNPVIDRAMALHKMIRLITCTCAGEGYLNFMGNEFGHPEWIDFPRQGNNWSYQYARRQWRLADDVDLRYHDLQAFDQAMIHLVKEHHLLAPTSRLLVHHEDNKIIAFAKGDCLLAFNFHPQRDVLVDLPAEAGQTFRLLLNTNWRSFGGYTEDEANGTALSCAQRNGRCVLPLRIQRREAWVVHFS